MIIKANIKEIYHDDGFGYTLREGDIGEMIMEYHEHVPKKLTNEVARICGTEMIRAVAEQMLELADEMEKRES